MTPHEDSKPNQPPSSPYPAGQATHHPTLPLRGHKESLELLTFQRRWEDATLRLLGSCCPGDLLGRGSGAGSVRSEQPHRCAQMSGSGCATALVIYMGELQLGAKGRQPAVRLHAPTRTPRSQSRAEPLDLSQGCDSEAEQHARDG